MPLSRPSRGYALGACAALFVASLPAPAAAPAQLRGRVLAHDGLTPRAGIVVTLAEPRGQVRHSSDPTTESGTFDLEGVPPGEYRLWVETPEGLFVAPEPVALSAGQALTLSLTLKPRDEGDEQSPPPPPPSQGRSKTVKWVLVGVVLVGAAAVVSIVNEEEEVASPF